MDWKNKVPGTFGVSSMIFAEHSLEEERAIDLLKECCKSNVALIDVIDEAKQYLISKSALTHHISSQVDRIKERFSGWLQ